MDMEKLRAKLINEADITETGDIRKEMNFIKAKKRESIEDGIRMWELYLMLAYRCIIDGREWTPQRYSKVKEDFNVIDPFPGFLLAYI